MNIYIFEVPASTIRVSFRDTGYGDTRICPADSGLDSFFATDAGNESMNPSIDIRRI